MSFTYEEFLNLSLPSDDSESHGNELRANWRTIGHVLAPQRVFYVSPSYTDSNLGNVTATDRRHFPTIQEAIDAAEATGHTSQNIIKIYPGTYPENLTIGGTISLVGEVSPVWEALGGGISTFINGVQSQAKPIITVNPVGTDYTCVLLENLCLGNSYGLDNPVEITEPYLIDIKKPAIYSYPVQFGMKNCQSRMQTWGDHNLWSYGIKSDGWVRLTIRDSDFYSWDYAGDEEDGGIRYMFDITGDLSNGHNAEIRAYNINLGHTYGGGGPITPALFNMSNGYSGRVGRSNFKPAGHLIKTDETGTVAGLQGATFDDYKNIEGVVFTWF